MISASYFSRSHGTMIEVSSPPEYAKTTVIAILILPRLNCQVICDRNLNARRSLCATAAISRDFLWILRHSGRLETETREKFRLERQGDDFVQAERLRLREQRLDQETADTAPVRFLRDRQADDLAELGRVQPQPGTADNAAVMLGNHELAKIA